jgi:hypothetical protein
MGMTLGPVPIYMRVGGGSEVEIGTVTPEVSDLNGAEQCVSVALPPLPELLRRFADELEQAGA